MTQHNCINHQASPAATQCLQCHKPICRICIFETEHGQFCSSTCSANHRAFRSTYLKQRLGEGSLAATLVKLAILALIVLGGIHAAVRWGGMDSLSGLDVLGKMLGRPAAPPADDPAAEPR